LQTDWLIKNAAISAVYIAWNKVEKGMEIRHRRGIGTPHIVRIASNPG